MMILHSISVKLFQIPISWELNLSAIYWAELIEFLMIYLFVMVIWVLKLIHQTKFFHKVEPDQGCCSYFLGRLDSFRTQLEAQGFFIVGL